MNYLLNRIEESNKYIDGLYQVIENPFNSSISISQIKENINAEDNLSDRAKKFYLSLFESSFFMIQVGFSFFKLTGYVFKHRCSEILPVIFKSNYTIIPISYPDLYRLLIKLPLNEKEAVLNNMNLSMTTLSGALTAIENSSEQNFVSILEKEPQDLTNTCRQLQVYNILYSCFSLIDVSFDLSDDINKYGLHHLLSSLFPYAYDVSSEQERDTLDKNINKASLNSKYIDELFKIITPDEILFNWERWDEIDNFLCNNKLPLIWISKTLIKTFVNLFTIIKDIFQNVGLSDEELNCFDKVLYENKDFEHIIILADRYFERKHRFEEENKSVTDESLEFVIPDDFFYNKMYTTESKEDEYIFSIYLSPTNDNNKKKLQALQIFINTIAENGNIEDNFNTKATFLYRMTGRKLPNTKPGVITWKDEMKNYNCFCYLVKNFDHDFLCQPKGNTRKGLYEKAQGFFGIIGNIDNPSAKANDIQKTKFNIYYEQFKKDMK